MDEMYIFEELYGNAEFLARGRGGAGNGLSQYTTLQLHTKCMFTNSTSLEEGAPEKPRAKPSLEPHMSGTLQISDSTNSPHVSTSQ